MDTEIGALLNETTEPVARYLRERDLDQWRDHPHPYAARRLCHRHRHPFRRRATGIDHDAAIIARFSLLAHVFHDAAYALYDRAALSPRLPALTERERECLRYSAHGLSAKEISRIIERSVPTVVMHLSGRRAEARRQEPYAGRRARRAFPPARRLT